MGRYYYDDGSWIETDAAGTSYAANSDGVVVSKVEADGDYFQSAAYWTDAREAAKLDPYVPRPAGDSRPWYERVAEYGLTRAIDANFGPQPVNKTGVPATFAGQNGRTYSTAGGAPVQSQGSILPLLAAAAVAFFALAG